MSVEYKVLRIRRRAGVELNFGPDFEEMRNRRSWTNFDSDSDCEFPNLSYFYHSPIIINILEKSKIIHSSFSYLTTFRAFDRPCFPKLLLIKCYKI